MFEFIERLRQKTTNAKRRIAFFASFSVSTFIFVIWLVAIYPDIKNTNKIVSKTNSSTPVETLTSFISEGIYQFKDKINNLANTLSIFSSSTSMYYATTTVPQKVLPLEESTTSESSFEEVLQ